MSDAHDLDDLQDSTRAQDDIARGIAVGGLVAFWCLVGIAAYFVRRRRQKQAADDAALHAETAVVL
jgi:hypothetical protein